MITFALYANNSNLPIVLVSLPIDDSDQGLKEQEY